MKWWMTLCLWSTAWAGPTVATVSDLKGTVERRPGAAGTWRAASLDEGLDLGDGVQTRVQSAAELTFVDGTVLALGERTRLAVSLMLFDPDQAPPEIRVALQAGEAEVHVAQVPLIMTLPSGEKTVFAPGTATRIRWRDGRFDQEPLPRLRIAPARLRSDELAPPRAPDPRLDAPDPARPLPGDSGQDGSGLRIRIQTRSGDE